MPAARQGWLPAAIAAALSLSLFGLAIPQTGAAFQSLYAGDIGDFAGAAGHASPSEALAAARRLEAVDGRFDDSWARLRAASLRLFLAYGGSGPPDRARLQRAVAELTEALARAPAADPVSWAALAQGRLALGERDAARRALHISMRLSSYDPRLSLWRTELGLPMIAALDPGDRQLWALQARLAWRAARSAMVALARRDPAAMALLSEALGPDPRLLRDFEEALAPPR